MTVASEKKTIIHDGGEEFHFALYRQTDVLHRDAGIQIRMTDTTY